MNNSTSVLKPLKASIALRPEFIAPERTVLHLTQHRSWSGGDFTARAPDGATILTSSGKWGSMSGRKELKDPSGLPLFDLRMSLFSFSNTWYLELPGGGQRILSMRYRLTMRQVKLEVTLKNAASATDEEVTLQVQGEDSHLVSTRVLFQGRPVAVIRKKSNGTFKVFSEFEVEVAAGMDQTLVGAKLSGELDIYEMHHYSLNFP
jgi:uncharacterized protein YxjI